MYTHLTSIFVKTLEGAMQGRVNPVLRVRNPAGFYVLPGKTRFLKGKWEQGFHRVGQKPRSDHRDRVRTPLD